MIVAETPRFDDKSPELEKKVEPDTPIQRWLLGYVGQNYEAELSRAKIETGKNIEWNGDVTVEMIVDVMAKEFPDFLFAIAEENFIRGYRQAFSDLDQGQALASSEAENE